MQNYGRQRKEHEMGEMKWSEVTNDILLKENEKRKKEW